MLEGYGLPLASMLCSDVHLITLDNGQTMKCSRKLLRLRLIAIRYNDLTLSRQYLC